jgi:hypothetical protein
MNLVAAGGVARGWDSEFESGFLQQRVSCEPDCGCLIAGASDLSATDSPTRPLDLANPGKDHQRLRFREPRYSSWELLPRHSDRH